jgi:peptide/nickel transport system permease protein
MVLYATRRALASVLVLLVATVLAFALVSDSSNPLDNLRARQPPVPEQTIQALRVRLYLDRPMADRYWLWLTGLGHTNGDIGVLQGKWGPSVRDVDIGAEIGERSLVSLRLLAGAIVLVLVVGVGSGLLSAVRRNTILAAVNTVIGYLALALPTFWVAAFVKDGAIRVNQLLGHRYLYTIGESSPVGSGVADVAGHLALPTLVLVLSGYAVVGRFQRAATIEVLESDYVRLARAKGLRSRVVLRRHALRNSLIPTAALAAVIASAAIAGTVIVEEVFAWRGLGSFLVDSVQAGDTDAVMAVVLLSGAVLVAANLAADLAVMFLDPRTRGAEQGCRDARRGHGPV